MPPRAEEAGPSSLPPTSPKPMMKPPLSPQPVASAAAAPMELKEADDRDAAIKVVIRCRPFLPFESGNASVVEILEGDRIKIVPTNQVGGSGSPKEFTFDATYKLESTQTEVYSRSIKPLVNACLLGYNATVIAYGQTGSGKTHSILGQTEGADPNLDPEQDFTQAGVIPRALRALFHYLKAQKEASTKKKSFDYNVKVEFLEIYGEDIRDLLQPNDNGPKLSIRDGKKGVEPEVLNIMKVEVTDAEEALLCLTRGTLRRVTRATQMNAESSRSHAIMTVVIEQKVTILVDNPAGGKPTKEESMKHSKFHFVDLAGSERIKRTGATGQGVKEGININKGLLVLGNVISALASQANSSKEIFVPYRDSKLTRLLKGSLGGNHKTLMIACVSPSGSNTEESLNTLRYANRAKNIQNKAVINMDAGSKLIAELREQLKGMAIEYLRARSFVADGVDLDPEGTIFTEDVLKALAGGSDVKLNLSDKTAAANVKLPKKSSKDDKKTDNASTASTSSTKDSTPAPSTAPSSSNRPATAQSTVSDASSGDWEQKLAKAKEEIKKLKRALEKSDDRVLETKRQLEWLEEELKVSKEEVLALSALDKTSEGADSDSNSNVSALTEDFGDMPRLSQETYETVKNIYEEKLVQMSLELKEREDERDNIAMTLYRHESDSQRLFYVKNTLTEDLTRKEEQIADLKSELRDMANLTIVDKSTPQTERQFRRLRGRANKKAASNASASMSAYYTEKLNKIDRHIKLREEECTNLGTELEKLEADAQIFTDLAKDLSERLKVKDEGIKEMNGKTKEQLSKLNVEISKESDEREQLVAELKRLKDDQNTFASLVKALTEERDTKLEHVDKYKRRHRELAASIGMTSPYVDSGSGDDVDDDASVSSTWSLMSIDTVATQATSAPNYSSVVSKIDYDTKISQLEANITKHEEDRIFILTDLEKLEADTHAFTELSNSLKQKLKMKEDQIETLKNELDEFAERLKKQENELQSLTKDDKKIDELTNGRGESVTIR